MARPHVNGSGGPNAGLNYLLAKAGEMPAAQGVEAAGQKLSVRADNVELAKATKASLLGLALEIESDLNSSRREAEHWRQQAARTRQQLDEELRAHAETTASLSLANITIDGLSKRVAHHHPRKG